MGNVAERHQGWTSSEEVEAVWAPVVAGMEEAVGTVMEGAEVAAAVTEASDQMLGSPPRHL